MVTAEERSERGQGMSGLWDQFFRAIQRLSVYYKEYNQGKTRLINFSNQIYIYITNWVKSWTR